MRLSISSTRSSISDISDVLTAIASPSTPSRKKKKERPQSVDITRSPSTRRWPLKQRQSYPSHNIGSPEKPKSRPLSLDKALPDIPASPLPKPKDSPTQIAFQLSFGASVNTGCDLYRANSTDSRSSMPDLSTTWRDFLAVLDGPDWIDCEDPIKRDAPSPELSVLDPYMEPVRQASAITRPRLTRKRSASLSSACIKPSLNERLACARRTRPPPLSITRQHETPFSLHRPHDLRISLNTEKPLYARRSPRTSSLAAFTSSLPASSSPMSSQDSNCTYRSSIISSPSTSPVLQTPSTSDFAIFIQAPEEQELGSRFDWMQIEERTEKVKTPEEVGSFVYGVAL